MSADRLDRVDELLCDHTLWGCEDHEHEELRSALVDPRNRREAFAFERTAAVLTAAMAARLSESPPESLRARLDQMAVGFVMERRNLSLAKVAEALDAEPSETSLPQKEAGSVAHRGWPGYALATAALVFAAAVFFLRDGSPERLPPPVQRAALLSEGGDVLRIEWAGEIGGDVCWSDLEQKGYMLFSGLSPNDPSQFQYQLWIFDRGREDTTEKPVDGGVFDVGPNREVVVPIRTNIRVHDAFAFAVTREPPGGVVVSDKDRIVATAGL